MAAPHTSAGRVPTAQGYRVFVDSLLQMQPLPDKEILRLRSNMPAGAGPQALLSSASELLSAMSQFVGVVTVPNRAAAAAVFAAATELLRAERLARLGTIESAFDPIPIDAKVARAWGVLAAESNRRCSNPRRRSMDLLIAATARAYELPLLTLDADLQPLGDLLEIIVPNRRTE